MGCLSTRLVVALALLLTGPSVSQRRGRLGTGTPVDFDCPEEFGYYPHPGDCTQYYVCVFGGALLESCTGGLMYSHELQTCDWPRNVGCGGEGGETATISTVRVTDPRTRQPTTPTGPSRSPPLSSRGQSDQQQRQQQEEIAKHQLYADDLGPAEEIESDRQQRVYRGQPSTLGQVARDRDGLRHSPVTNAIPSPAGRVPSGDKIAVISFGNQQPPQNTQYRVEPSVAPAYVQQPVQQVPQTPSAYNSSQQYEPAQYDQYYSLYDEDVELYRDVDYSQYTGSQGQTSGTSNNNNNNNNNNQQYRGPSPYKQAPQQPTAYAQPTYNTQDVYSQGVNAQDYNENYNTQTVEDQYRQQQLPARKPTAAPTRSNRNELNISHESTSTTIPSTTTTTSTTTSTVAPARQQTRQRGEAATTPQTTRSTQANIPEEFQTLWNLPSQNSDSRPTPSPRQTSEQKPAPRRVTLTAALSLDEPFVPDTKTSRNQANSRRVSLTSNDSGNRRGTSEVVPVTSSRSSQSSRSQNTPRRVSGKSFAVADVPNSRASARGSEVITIEDVEPTRFNASASESDSSVRKVANTPSRGRSDSNPQVDIISVARSSQRSAKLISNSAPSKEVEFARQPSLKASVDSNDFSDSDSDSLTSSRSLSRNSIAQLESTTTRSRARGNKQTSCNDEVETNSNTGCTEKPQLRVRPTTASPDSQTTPVPARAPARNRGSASYTAADETVNRGTPASVRSRPTLKPSTAIVSKAQEFIDIYKYPPRRPDPVYPQPTPDKTAAKCRKDVCLLPDCNCGGKDIPGDLQPEELPQIVLLTFDDAVNDLNKGLYSDLFEKGRKNPNGCPITATFYVSHEWTDYSQVQNLYADGHEMASHSVSHSFGEQFSQKKWTREIGGQREILAAYGGVKLEDVRGMRAPFLAVGGNKMFKMLYDSNFTYDSSMPVYENRPPSWPYTLDYKIFHDCMIPPCPTRSYPGVWEVPMVMWQDLNGGRCSMGDACSNPPTADGVYKMLIKNFERHYTTNRAPFGLFYHAAWFTQPHHKEGFIAFLDTIVNMQDVWLVTNWQAIQWVRDPTPLSRINNFQPFQCNYADRPKRCNNPKVCNLWHKSGVRYMRTCQPCPDIYPWTGKTGVRNSRVDNEVFEE
ncbi:uncharacterized protein Cda5 [Anabrus simplex]|uniref:uncharacterized protein Cda5 n=1 Tax=Anabrus simplex TaxID=316456 RepID=UPI0035A2CE82